MPSVGASVRFVGRRNYPQLRDGLPELEGEEWQSHGIPQCTFGYTRVATNASKLARAKWLCGSLEAAGRIRHRKYQRPQRAHFRSHAHRPTDLLDQLPNQAEPTP
jgi:hypothetical protein